MKDMKKWLLLLLAGWSTLVVGLFLGGLSGDVAAQLFGLSKTPSNLVKGLVMSGIVVPIILYLYKHVYRMTGVKPAIPVYSWKRMHHFITGLLYVIALASIGFMIASSLGWSVIEKWHPPDQWLAALLINMVVAYLFEALPEELGLRGMLYDVLHHRFAVWLAIPIQMLLFISLPISVTQLQVWFGLAPGNTIDLFYIVTILSFGLGLQLIRLWTGSLWATMGFHLGYLEIMRFVILPHGYGAPPILSYSESAPGMGGIIPWEMMIFGSVIVSLVILGVKRLIRKKKVIQTNSLT